MSKPRPIAYQVHYHSPKAAEWRPFSYPRRTKRAALSTERFAKKLATDRLTRIDPVYRPSDLARL